MKKNSQNPSRFFMDFKKLLENMFLKGVKKYIFDRHTSKSKKKNGFR